MSLRFRKSMKLMPGVRLNFSTNSMGISVGVPGARYTVNTKGRRTITTGIPGTGIYNVETISSGKSSNARRKSQPLQTVETYSAPIKPKWYARKSEKEFFKFLRDIYGKTDNQVDDIKSVITKGEALQGKYPDLQMPLDAVFFTRSVAALEFTELSERLGNAIWKERDKYFSHPLSVKYFPLITVIFSLTRGITSELDYTVQSFGFAWAEALQAADRQNEALEVLQDLAPDQLVGIALADLEISMGNFDGAIETTEDIENEDDATAMMLILRGIEFREKSLNDAALECFKRALSSKKRSEGVLHRALLERSTVYLKLGKKAMARKDLERILVDDPSSVEANEALKSLPLKVEE